MVDHPANQNVLGLTAQIVSAHVSNNSVSPDALPSLIQEVYKTLGGGRVRSRFPPRGPSRLFPSKNLFFPTTSSVLRMGKNSRC